MGARFDARSSPNSSFSRTSTTMTLSSVIQPFLKRYPARTLMTSGVEAKRSFAARRAASNDPAALTALASMTAGTAI